MYCNCVRVAKLMQNQQDCSQEIPQCNFTTIWHKITDEMFLVFFKNSYLFLIKIPLFNLRWMVDMMGVDAICWSL